MRCGGGGGDGVKEERVKEGERCMNVCENNGCNTFLVGKCESKIITNYVLLYITLWDDSKR